MVRGSHMWHISEVHGPVRRSASRHIVKHVEKFLYVRIFWYVTQDVIFLSRLNFSEFFLWCEFKEDRWIRVFPDFFFKCL